MAWMHPAAIAHQRRLLRPDAARWLRPDAVRWLPPEVARLFERSDEPEAKSAPPPMPADEFDRELESIHREYLELKAPLAARKFERTWAAFRAKAYNPNQPRVPAGNPDGGQWTDADGSSQTVSPSAKPLMRLVGDPPTGDSPEVPDMRPPSSPERHAVVKSVARWLGRYGGALGKIAQVGHWLYEYDDLITPSLDPPKSIDELHDGVSDPRGGYDIHHIVEKTPAAQEGYPREMIESRENLVRIPRLKHWEINGWYQTKNEMFEGLSPRDYLRDKSWDERTRVGLYALRKHGVLAP